MKLTKAQRHTAYIIMLAEAEADEQTLIMHNGSLRFTTESGLCWMFNLLFDCNEIYFDFEKMLPELFKKATTPDSCFLWRNWEERKQALKQCINKTYNF